MSEAGEDAPFLPGGSQHFIALIPGGGWMLWRDDNKGGWSDPVVAWALQDNGDLVAIEADEGACVGWPIRFGDAGEGELWHPASSSATAQARLAQYRRQLGGPSA